MQLRLQHILLGLLAGMFFWALDNQLQQRLPIDAHGQFGVSVLGTVFFATALPATVDPFREGRSLSPHCGRIPVARERNRVIGETEQRCGDRIDDRVEGAVGESCGAGPAREEGVPGHGDTVEQQAG